MLHIGKHKGKNFDETVLEDKDYADWVMSLRGDPGGFKDFIHYMVHNPAVDEPPPSKKQRADEETCKICFQVVLPPHADCVGSARGDQGETWHTKEVSTACGWARFALR